MVSLVGLLHYLSFYEMVPARHHSTPVSSHWCNNTESPLMSINSEVSWPRKGALRPRKLADSVTVSGSRLWTGFHNDVILIKVYATQWEILIKMHQSRYVHMFFFLLFLPTPSWIVIPFDVSNYVIHRRVQLPNMDLGLDGSFSSQAALVRQTDALSVWLKLYLVTR